MFIMQLNIFEGVTPVCIKDRAITAMILQIAETIL